MKKYDWASRIPVAVAELIRVLDAAGFESWLVGGCVRDMTLGIIPDDYDVATNARPEQVRELFRRCLLTGLKHGTVTVLIENYPIEVTTFRSEGPYSDGRRPDHVRYEQQIMPDLERRDFTINSMAWHPERGLLDPHGGLTDLQHQVLRCVGSAQQRLQEDALRQLRAVRFAVTYDLQPDTQLIDAVRQNYTRMRQLSPERVGNEMMRLVRSAYAHRLTSFSGTGLLAQVAEKMLSIDVDDRSLCWALLGFLQPFWHKKQVWPLFYLACLLAKHRIMPTDSNHNGLPDAFHLADWLEIRHDLTRNNLYGFYHQMTRCARLSGSMAAHGRTILYFIGIRLLLLKADLRNSSSDRQHTTDFRLSANRLRIVMRTGSRIARLPVKELLDSFIDALAILRALQQDPVFQVCLDYERAFLEKMRENAEKLLLTVQQLEINGSSPVFAVLDDARQTGLYLERLLSHNLQSDHALNRCALETLLASWLKDGK